MSKMVWNNQGFFEFVSEDESDNNEEYEIDEQTSIKCRYCNSIMMFLDYNNHLREKHPDCIEVQKEERAFKRKELQNIKAIVLVECEYCSLKIEKELYWKHIKLCHSTETPENSDVYDDDFDEDRKIYTCKYCKKQLINFKEQEYKEHLKKCKAIDEAYGYFFKCPFCKKEFNHMTQNEIDKHKETCESKIKKDSESTMSKDRKKLRRHIVAFGGTISEPKTVKKSKFKKYSSKETQKPASSPIAENEYNSPLQSSENEILDGNFDHIAYGTEINYKDKGDYLIRDDGKFGSSTLIVDDGL